MARWLPARRTTMPEIRRILVALKPAFAQSRMPELAVKVASEIRAEVEALL